MRFTLFEKAVAVLFFAGTVFFYLALAWVRLRPFGATLRARIDALLSYREPAIVLDSARVLALFAWMRNTPDVEMTTEYLRRGIAWTDPVGVFQWVSVFHVPPAAVPILLWTFRLALGLAAVGIAGRAASAVAAVLHALLWSIGYSTVGYSVHNHVVFMILLSLALAPEPYVPLWKYVRAVRDRSSLASVGSYFSYVRFVAAFAIVTVYVQTGIEKVLHGTPRWFNGITLQGHSMRKGELSTALAQLPTWTFTLLALGVVAWETLFGLVLFYKRWRAAAVVSGWGFHEFVRYVMGVRPFSFMMSSCLFIYTPYEAWRFIAERFLKKKHEAIEPAPVSSGDVKEARPTLRTPSVVLLALLLVVQWVPTALRRGAYPFLGNAMFSSSLLKDDVLPAEARAVVRLADGSEREIPAPEAVAIHWITFTGVVFAHYRSPYKDDHDRFAGTENTFCQTILREIVAHAEPRAVSLSLHHDYFVAGHLGLQTEVLHTCSLDAPAGTPADKAPASPSTFPSNP